MTFPPDNHPYYPPPYAQQKESGLCWTMFVLVASVIVIALMWCPWWQEIFKTWPPR